MTSPDGELDELGSGQSDAPTAEQGPTQGQLEASQHDPSPPLSHNSTRSSHPTSSHPTQVSVYNEVTTDRVKQDPGDAAVLLQHASDPATQARQDDPAVQLRHASDPPTQARQDDDPAVQARRERQAAIQARREREAEDSHQNVCVELDMMPHEGAQTRRDIVDWLSSTASAAVPSSKRERRASESSSVLSAYVDKILGPDFAKGGKDLSTTRTAPAFRPSVNKRKAKQIPSRRHPGCDACKARRRKCINTSRTRRTCDSCHQSHIACKRNGVHVTASFNASAGNSLSTGRHGFHWGQGSELVANSKAGAGHREIQTSESESRDTEQLVQDSTDSDDDSEDDSRNRQELPRKRARADTLDRHTINLIRDVQAALQRFKRVVPSATALLAFRPTLRLLQEDLDDIAHKFSEPLLSSISLNLDRIREECIGRDLNRQNEVSQQRAIWLAQALVDRSLSHILTLLDDV